MTFQPGHKLAKGGRKEKPWRDALIRAIKRKEEGLSVGRALELIADKCLADAIDGDKDARREIAERLDGKVAQAIVGDSDEDPINVITKIERVIVDGDNAL